MHEDKLNILWQYGAANAIAIRLHKSGLITDQEYHKLSDVIDRKYQPLLRTSNPPTQK